MVYLCVAGTYCWAVAVRSLSAFFIYRACSKMTPNSVILLFSILFPPRSMAIRSCCPDDPVMTGAIRLPPLTSSRLPRSTGSSGTDPQKMMA